MPSSFDLKRKVARALTVLLATATFTVAALAAYPDRPIKLIVPWPPGGGSDSVARIISKRLSERLGQPVVIDNRAGATGLIGTDAAVKAVPDGYTLVFIADSYLVSPHASPKVAKYDPRKDFTDISIVGYVPFVLVVNAEKHPGGLAPFIEEAKKPSSNLSFSSWGVGSSGQMAMEMFKAETGARLTHIPFQGAAPAMTAVLGAQVDALFVPLVVALPHHRSGKAKILGVAAKQRFSGAPDLPTMTEQGIGSWLSWMGVLGPAKMPADIAARLNAELKAMSEEPQFREALIKAGVDPSYTTQQELSRFVGSEYDRLGKVVRDAKITVD